MNGTVEQPKEINPTTSSDGCDACGFQPSISGLGAGVPVSSAYARAVHPDGRRDLLLCGHHLNEHGVSLIAAGWEIRDDRQRLLGSGA